MKPEIGRGCAFGYDEQSGEAVAQMADGCFKLHETGNGKTM